MHWDYDELCDWIDNGCDMDTGLKVITLNFSCHRHKKISIFPTEIGLLQNLQQLDCSHNNITFLPSNIGRLKNLQLLACEHNFLTELPPDIGELQNLEQLFCGDNKLKFLPANIGKLQNLKCFDCSKNTLTYLPSEIGSLRNLEVFKCEKNELTELPQTIGQLQNLKIFKCSNNKIFPEKYCKFNKNTNFRRGCNTFNTPNKRNKNVYESKNSTDEICRRTIDKKFKLYSPKKRNNFRKKYRK